MSASSNHEADDSMSHGKGKRSHAEFEEGEDDQAMWARHQGETSDNEPHEDADILEGVGPPLHPEVQASLDASAGAHDLGSQIPTLAAALNQALERQFQALELHESRLETLSAASSGAGTEDGWNETEETVRRSQFPVVAAVFDDNIPFENVNEGDYESQLRDFRETLRDKKARAQS